ncbi:hypothetical protein [Candidatus Wolbachia massiliensis]|uniref:Uncharacterized protein n=1 Tax=Candidatus Wolbachia massiliensis TaxID=1845000 RepID=A0A7M3U1X9_9RICK|nr:hypothetical protein [Candidatus Wolbachia massiliensis]QOD38414.1 hypothetical protein ID128_00635 [Candidatus Wolbachia massiliensis]
MPNPVNEDNVISTSYRQVDENDKITGTPPIVELGNVAQKNDGDIDPPSPKKAENLISSILSNVTSREPSETVSASSGVGESLGDGSVEHIYAQVQKRRGSLSSLKSNETNDEDFDDEDDSQKSLLTNNEPGIDSDTTLNSKKTNRAWPRAKYAMQQKGFIIFGASAIILSTSAALIYLQDKAKFIAFFTNSPKYVTIPVIALATLLAISPIFCAIKQFRNTEEYQTQGKDADEILDKVLEQQPKDKAIKSVRLEYSNGTHSNFILNAWESKNDFINIDEKVISRTNKVTSVINDRPLFTALLTGVVAANIAFPLGLLAIDGVNGVQKFYQNPLNHNVGLSLLIGSGVLALLIVCLGVHYYRKTNCTNLIYSQEKIDTENVNEKLIEEIKHQRTNVLEENHSKDAKRSSLTLEQVVIQSHNCKDAVYSVG